MASEPPKSSTSETHNLQVAQVLADLNQLQLATDQKAALSLLQISDTLDRRQSISKHILPTPENVFNSPLKNKRSASALQRLNTSSSASSTNEGRRAGVTPLLREQSSVSVSSTGSLGEHPSDPDLHRAQTLLTLHSTRSSFLKAAPSSTSNFSNPYPFQPPNLDTSRQTISDIASRYTMLKNEEMRRDPEGMKRALREVGFGV